MTVHDKPAIQQSAGSLGLRHHPALLNLRADILVPNDFAFLLQLTRS